MLVNERFSGSCYRAQTLASILAKSLTLQFSALTVIQKRRLVVDSIVN